MFPLAEMPGGSTSSGPTPGVGTPRRRLLSPRAVDGRTKNAPEQVIIGDQVFTGATRYIVGALLLLVADLLFAGSGILTKVSQKK